MLSSQTICLLVFYVNNAIWIEQWKMVLYRDILNVLQRKHENYLIMAFVCNSNVITGTSICILAKATTRFYIWIRFPYLSWELYCAFFRSIYKLILFYNLISLICWFYLILSNFIPTQLLLKILDHLTVLLRTICPHLDRMFFKPPKGNSKRSKNLKKDLESVTELKGGLISGRTCNSCCHSVLSIESIKCSNCNR